MRVPYCHAKAKNLKLYSQEDINSASGLEKKRREFWNGKAKQLAKNKKTRQQSKTALAGIIDVSWTLHKTSMLETEAKKILDDEKVLFRKEDVTSRKGSQKKETIPNNIERMSATHEAVEELDKKTTNRRDVFESAKTSSLRKKNTKKYKKEQLLLDGAYTELKHAQDALTKSMKVKRKEIEDRLRSGDDHAEDTS